MGLIHTPRTIASIAKGYWKFSKNSEKSTAGKVIGLGVDNPHIYSARAGVFDVDYLGHMNNTAYLTHAELARWELTAENGLMKDMIRANAAFIVTANSIRYRRQIKAFRKFQIETSVTSLTDRDIWLTHNFREAKDNDRIRAQILVKAAIVRNRKVIDPREFFLDHCGIPKAAVDELGKQDPESLVQQEIRHYMELEKAQRSLASLDDEIVQTKNP